MKCNIKPQIKKTHKSLEHTEAQLNNRVNLATLNLIQVLLELRCRMLI